MELFSLILFQTRKIKKKQLLRKFLIFQEMELSCLKLKKLLILQDGILKFQA